MVLARPDLSPKKTKARKLLKKLWHEHIFIWTVVNMTSISDTFGYFWDIPNLLRDFTLVTIPQSAWLVLSWPLLSTLLFPTGANRVSNRELLAFALCTTLSFSAFWVHLQLIGSFCWSFGSQELRKPRRRGSSKRGILRVSGFFVSNGRGPETFEKEGSNPRVVLLSAIDQADPTWTLNDFCPLCIQTIFFQQQTIAFDSGKSPLMARF